MALVILLIPLAGYGYAGTYSRYMADDYCTAGSLSRNGFVGSQAYWFNHWSGRYSFTFTVTLLELIGIWVTRLLPFLAILLWVSSLYFATREIRTSIGIFDEKLSIFILSCFVVLATLIGAPNIYQSLYWQTGMVTYVLPLILMTAFFAWMIRMTRRSTSDQPALILSIISALIAFLLGGFSETYVSLQTAALGCFFILSLFLLEGPSRSTAVRLIGGGLMGSIASMIVIASAPGTSVRQGLFSLSFSLASLLGDSLYDWYIFTARTVKSMPILLLMAVLLPSLLVVISQGKRIVQNKLTKRQTISLLILIPLMTFLLMLATIVPYEFALSSYPDGRVLITSQYVLISGMAAWGIILSGIVSQFIGQQRALQRTAMAMSTFLVLLGSVYISSLSVSQILAPIGDYQDFAQSWDARHGFLQSVPEESDNIIQVASLTHIGGLSEIGYDENEWVNRCVAWMYGLDGVIAK